MKLYSTSEVAEILQVNTQAVARWARIGKISALRLPNGEYRIPETELTQFLEDLRRITTSNQFEGE